MNVGPMWDAVDALFNAKLIPHDAVLDAALAASDAAALPAIQVTAAQGKFLNLLVQISGARRVLEIGTLGGYSTIWMARALPLDGTLISLEIDERHATLARENLSRAGLQDRVTVLTAPALESLATLAAQHAAPFDLVFIDADKANIPAYFEASLGLSHVGSVIVVDNVVREGKVLNADSTDQDIQGVRRLAQQLAGDTRVAATVLQTVGSKGYDGFLIARVVSLM